MRVSIMDARGVRPLRLLGRSELMDSELMDARASALCNARFGSRVSGSGFRMHWVPRSVSRSEGSGGVNTC